MFRTALRQTRTGPIKTVAGRRLRPGYGQTHRFVSKRTFETKLERNNSKKSFAPSYDDFMGFGKKITNEVTKQSGALYEGASQLTSEQAEKLLETGTEQAIQTLNTINSKLDQYTGKQYTTTVSFTVGPFQVSFTETTQDKKN